MPITNLLDEQAKTQASDGKLPVDDHPFYYQPIKDGIMNSIYKRGDHPYFHPSSLSACPRCMFLNLHGISDWAPGLSLQKRMDAGTSIHEKWEHYVRQSGMFSVMKHRIKLQEPLWITGEPDIIIINPESFNMSLIELKSKDSMAYDNHAQPTWANRAQWMIYSWMIERENLYHGRYPNKGWIQMEEMNRQGWRAFRIERNDEWLEEKMLPVLYAAQEGYMKGVIPEPREVKRGKKRVKYIDCPNCTKVLEELERDNPRHYRELSTVSRLVPGQ